MYRYHILECNYVWYTIITIQRLKDAFIPHEGNNYHPHILQTKRAVLYTGVSLAIKIIAIGFVLALPQEAFLLPDVLLEQKKELAILVDSARKDRNIPLLSTSGKLEQSSQLKATDLVEKQYFSHTTPEGKGFSAFLKDVGYEYTVAGENLAMGFSNPKAVVDAWIASPLHYKNLADGEFNEQGLGIDSGLYDGKDTIFIAHHFGKPKQYVTTAQAQSQEANKKLDVSGTKISQPEPVVQQNNNQEQVSQEQEKQVQIETQTEAGGAVFLPIIYHKDRSKVYWQELDADTIQLTANAYIEGEVSRIEVFIKDVLVPLKQGGEGGLYSGSIVVNKSVKDIFEVVIAPVIQIEGAHSEKITDAIDWDRVVIVSPGPVEKYIALHRVLPKVGIGVPLAFVRWLYFAFIAFFAFCLMLKIFIEIRKQHYHIIGQTLLLIGLFVLLLVM